MTKDTIKPDFNLFVALVCACGTLYYSPLAIDAALRGELKETLIIGGCAAVNGIGSIVNYVVYAKNKKLDDNANKNKSFYHKEE